jgi:predicted ATP-grasp superfamily ATP-dependent carboligase
MKSTATILVLDGQTNQALACVRSLGRAGCRVLVASHRARPLAAWSRHSAGSFRLAGQTREAFAELRAWAVKSGVNVVLPLTERACLLMNAERERWEARGVTVGCGPTPMLAAAFDKAKTLRLAESCGVRTPPTHFPRSLAECRAAAEAVGFPCVVKPRESNAWDGERFLPDRGCAYASSINELLAAVASRRQGDEWPLIQGYVAGTGKGAFALCDSGRVVAWFAHERLRDVNPTGSGSSLRRAVRLDERLRGPAEKLLAAMRWHGPAMVEFRDDGAGAPCLMEVNGRFWTSLQLAVDAGVDFPRLWAGVLRGEAVEPVQSYAEGVTLRWLWGDVKRLLYVLRGRPAGFAGAYPTRAEGVKELFGAQPAGTRPETWRAGDRWPAVGEFVQGVSEVLSLGERGRGWQGFWRTRIQTGRTTEPSLSKNG